ncbi:terminase large subunit domain-containing protein [Tissierella praeacuta]|uniref:terminase large subunit domain-containing protein n=1 Tax=Tissierella praeacuta TaxID=43131 RepID=UPI003DA3337B
MASIKNYQGDFRRRARSKNLSIQPKQMIKKSTSDEWEENLIDWTTFYRRNIHRFIEHYFQIKLHLYQVIWIYFMSICDSFVSIASRASAKSWLIAVLALARAVLYPNSEVVVVAKTKKQAGIIFGKIEQLMKDHPNIEREVSDFKNSQNDRHCKLYNSSKIVAVICDEGGRGERSNFTIGEEFRLMDKDKYDSIVRPFAIARQSPYLKNPKYSHLIEEPKEILITSAYYKNLWWYGEMEENIKMMLRGEKAGVFFLDYAIAIKHGIKTKKLIAKDKQKMDMISFQQEYENIPFGESSDAYFKYDMFSKNRDIKSVFYPLRKDHITKNKNPFAIKRRDGEIRVVSVDIATRKGRENDNTIITCIRGIPTKKGYMREYVYMESHHGEHTGKQALRIKQIYNDFSADYIVLDLQNAGITLFERLATLTKDEERGVEYEAYTVMDHKSLSKQLLDELREKTLVKSAKPIIYPISASQKLNSDIAVNFRDILTRGMASFPIDASDADEHLNEHNEEFKKTDDTSLKAWYLHPYIEFSYMVNETINLSYSISSGNIVLKEPNGARKDRYTSASYGGYFISLLENDLLKEEEGSDESDPLVFF